MKSIILILVALVSVIGVSSNILYANDDPNIGQNTPATTSTTATNNDTSTDNVLGVANNQLRTGTVDMNTIPEVIISIMNVMLGIAGTISIVALIYYSVLMQINSGITGDSSGVDKAKTGMKGAIFGFILAILAWFIIVRLIEVLSSVF